jgi:hypothetical protein
MECLDITPLMRFSEIFGIGRVDDRLLAPSGHVALLVRYPVESMVVEILSETCSLILVGYLPSSISVRSRHHNRSSLKIELPIDENKQRKSLGQ